MVVKVRTQEQELTFDSGTLPILVIMDRDERTELVALDDDVYCRYPAGLDHAEMQEWADAAAEAI